ncbi:MAG: hypothetical protein J6T97_06230 [Bacteroidaceae bacterium]|nr:hypothetical protein [Bacteroidaceae bacterium]
MKKAFLPVIFAALFAACTTTAAKEQSKVLTYASNTHGYERIVQVTDVEYTDTATILTFFFKNRLMPGTICILPQTYLSDEQDRHYKALFGVEHPLGEYFFPDKDGTYFHVGFEPLAAGVQIFDMIEGNASSQFQIMGIHAPSYKPAKPEFSQEEIKEARKIRSAIFNKGVVCLRGTIQGYDRSHNYRTFQLLYSDYFRDDNNTTSTIALEIDSLGHFETSFDVNHAIGASIIDQRNTWHSFIALAGDTLDVVFMEDASTKYSLSDGREYPLDRYNRLSQNINTVDGWTIQFDKSMNLSKALDYARLWKTLGLEFVDYLTAKYGFTAFEYEFARIMADQEAFEAYVDYRLDAQEVLFTEGDLYSRGKGFLGKLLSLGIDRKLTKPDALEFLSGFSANDTLMVILPVEWTLFDRYKYDQPFFAPAVVTADDQPNAVFKYAWQAYLTDSTHLANDMKLFGLDEPSLLGKICVLQDMTRHLDSLKTIVSAEGGANTDAVLMSYLSKMKELINDDNLAALADLVYKDFIRTKTPYWDLPDCRGTEVLKSILAKYPGKYVYLDFWSTGCGPCMADIKNLYQNNHKLMTDDHDKFVMVFITDDPTYAYEPFRQEWLEGAQSYKVSKDDFNAMAGLFNFSAIPHHELITPDGRAVSAVPPMLTVNPENPEGK